MLTFDNEKERERKAQQEAQCLNVRIMMISTEMKMGMLLHIFVCIYCNSASCTVAVGTFTA